MSKNKTIEHKSNKKVVLAIVSIIVILAVVLFLFSSSSPILHPAVTVEGTVITDPLTTPVTVIFYGSASSYQASVSNGSYSINLPSNENYSVTVVFSALISTGNNTCNAGELYLPSTQSVYAYNPSC